MIELVFASNNANKLHEIKQVLGSNFTILSLKDIGCFEELPETTGTIAGNALQKARYVFDHYGKNCFADDTGLEVEVLNGLPGVDSAFYAGPQKNANDNMDKLLFELQATTNRKALFKTVIALVMDGHDHLFEGVVVGEITDKKLGDKGFGYDPVFKPTQCDKTFAQMDTVEKNKYSHRARAVQKLISFFNTP